MVPLTPCGLTVTRILTLFRVVLLPLYALILNGFRGMYQSVGKFYFDEAESRQLVDKFYQDLIALAESGEYDKALYVVRNYGIASSEIWKRLRHIMPSNVMEVD